MRNRTINPEAMRLHKAQGTAGYAETETGEETLIPAGFLVSSISELVTIQKRYLRQLESRALEVDEYSPQTLAGASGTVFTVTPQFSSEYFEAIDHIIITGPTPGTSGAIFEGSAAAPTANSDVLSIAAAALPPVGTYTLSIKLDLDGTVGAVEVNNMKLVFGGTTLVTFAIDGAVGSYPQTPVVLTIPPGNTNLLKVKAVGAATAGSTYTAEISFTPVQGYPVIVQLGDRVWNLTIPFTGVLELSPKKLILAYQDIRQLTAAIPGAYSLELLGVADVRNRFI